MKIGKDESLLWYRKFDGVCGRAEFFPDLDVGKDPVTGEVVRVSDCHKISPSQRGAQIPVDVFEEYWDAMHSQRAKQLRAQPEVLTGYDVNITNVFLYRVVKMFSVRLANKWFVRQTARY